MRYYLIYIISKDFDLFLVALEAYEDYACTIQALPSLFVGITGKGPEKQKYADIFRLRQPHWKYITIQ
jgi:hypothetical protein